MLARSETSLDVVKDQMRRGRAEEFLVDDDLMVHIDEPDEEGWQVVHVKWNELEMLCRIYNNGMPIQIQHAGKAVQMLCAQWKVPFEKFMKEVEQALVRELS